MYDLNIKATTILIGVTVDHTFCKLLWLARMFYRPNHEMHTIWPVDTQENY